MTLQELGMKMIQNNHVMKSNKQVSIKTEKKHELHLYYNHGNWYLAECGLVIWCFYPKILPFMTWISMIRPTESIIWNEKDADFKITCIKDTDLAEFQIQPKAEYRPSYTVTISVSEFIETIRNDVRKILSESGMKRICREYFEFLAVDEWNGIQDEYIEEMRQFCQYEPNVRKLIEKDGNLTYPIVFFREANLLRLDPWLHISDKKYTLNDVFSVYDEIKGKDST